MATQNGLPVLKVQGNSVRATRRPLVVETPVRLEVNGRELATLIASPHQLNFLVAGFLRLQGFINTLDEITSLGVCSEFGVARVRTSTPIPEKLHPTLTSGCGTGISFNLPEQAAAIPATQVDYPAEAILTLMRDLAREAEHYRTHGGIHSAAIGDGEKLLLFSEDIGRHNTLDRIAGAALFRNIDLAGKILVTSGRVSTEMVAKAARCGIAVIASRTSPTQLAVTMADEAGITLVGYVRGSEMEVYTHPERLRLSAPVERIEGVTGVILAGGESRRMGSDKSLLPFEGARFIDHVYRVMCSLFDEVIIVTNSPTLYDGIDCRKVPDIYYAQGSLAGIHSGLCHASNERIFVAACDMPFLNPELVRAICADAPQGDLVIPMSDHGPEPLHACYAKSCLPAMEEVLDAGHRRIVRFFSQVHPVEMPTSRITPIDPQGLSFRNINTPEEYFALRESKGLERPEAKRQNG